MNRNKIITAIIIFSIILSLLLITACETNTTQYAIETEISANDNNHAEADTFAQPYFGELFQRGTWENDVFTSEYLGLNFLLPDGWFIASDIDIAYEMGVSVDLMDQLSEFDIAGLMDMAALDVVYDMMASSLAGAKVLIFYQRLVYPLNQISETEYIEWAAKRITEVGVDVHFDYPGTTRIGNYDWHSFGTSVNIMGIDILGRQFINIHDGFAREIIISYNDMTEPIDEILHMFFGLDDPIPEPAQTERAEVLVGAWVWDLDSSYVITFHADGQMTRGFSEELEEFTWSTRGNDTLTLEDGAAIESWTFIINSDVLTLDSNHDPDFTFSYVRVEE